MEKRIDKLKEIILKYNQEHNSQNMDLVLSENNKG